MQIDEAQVRDFERRFAEAEAALAREKVSGSSKDGTVTLVASGLGVVREARIDPAVFDHRDVEKLQNAFVEALRATAAGASEAASARLGDAEITLS